MDRGCDTAIDLALSSPLSQRQALELPIPNPWKAAVDWTKRLSRMIYGKAPPDNSSKPLPLLACFSRLFRCRLGLRRSLDVEVSDVERIVFDELAPGFDGITH